MGYWEIRPSPQLASYIECFWISRSLRPAPGQRILPDGCVDIVFSTRKSNPVGLNVVGLMTRPLTRNFEATEEFFGVRFRPGAASAFIPDAPGLTDRIEPLESFWGSTARTLRDRLANASAPQQMAEMFESLANPRWSMDGISLAVTHLATPGAPPSRLSDMAGQSERSFRRGCLARVGVPPKLLARILRFRNASDRIRQSSAGRAQPNWAEFAAACGYYDQSHMIREFHEFAGCTPGRFIQYGTPSELLPSQEHESNQTEPPNRLC
ncbi:MAG: helix-turn-helix domain-containing protein [Bryobacter sp.]|jgi:AraC-like DNA-binding protein|nr:helix-turn-helix domain-containing protein [Bryobacter sp. CoA8 C33]